ncbi:MAG TPA: hypothetical protein VF137_08980 [Candidatus Dormibacteraeota bacterium]
MAAFLANVGVNASHAARSPLRSDGSFTVLPIPERGQGASPMRHLDDAELQDLAALAPLSWRTRAVHLDPDFRTDPPTYGDNCRTAGRAFSLRRALPGDVIWFAARLHPAAAPPSLHLVAQLTIDAIEPDVTSDPGPGWWDGNAHVRRARANLSWDSFWVFRGAEPSGWLPAAIPFTRALAQQLFGPWEWPSTATEQQVIAWHTRAVRRIGARA